MNTEEWRTIAGYHGRYEVSNLGRVRRGSYVMTPFVSHGYLRIKLCYRGSNRRHMVHRLVAEAFLTRLPICTCVNHIDGNKQNNALGNLEWCTQSQNERHKRDVLGMMVGETHHMAKLNNAKVAEIRQRASRGEVYDTIAADMGCTPENIGMIVTRKTWRHVA